MLLVRLVSCILYNKNSFPKCLSPNIDVFGSQVRAPLIVHLKIEAEMKKQNFLGVISWKVSALWTWKVHAICWWMLRQPQRPQVVFDSALACKPYFKLRCQFPLWGNFWCLLQLNMPVFKHPSSLKPNWVCKFSLGAKFRFSQPKLWLSNQCLQQFFDIHTMWKNDIY